MRHLLAGLRLAMPCAAGAVGKVLDERPAPSHVEQLGAPADRQDRHGARIRPRRQGQLEASSGQVGPR